MLGHATTKPDWRDPELTPGKIEEEADIPEQGEADDELIELHLTVKSESGR